MREKLLVISLPVNSDWEIIGFIEGNGTSTQQHDYTYLDNDKLSGIYSYRLKQIDFNGSFTFSKTINVNINIINEFQLSQNYPNPFNPSTKIGFTISDVGFVKLKVYDVLGNEIITLVNKEMEPGKYSINFDGSNLPSGIYFYKLAAGNFVQVKKMMLVK